jgi:asparagine synthase (glutamine-hydrolysing)
MTEFRGMLTPAGTLVLAGGPDGRAVEQHLGCQVVVSGYLADRAALCRSLGLGPPQRPSDGEILAHAFRKWGHRLECHVLGEFAVVLCDTQTGTGLLTHDSFGLVPLFYACGPDGLAFSTTLVGLLDAARCADLDDEYLADFLALGVATGERTPYRAIRRLLPGRAIWWSDGRLSERQGWNLADVPPSHCRDDGEYEERFRAELEAGVRSALDTAGPAWVFLSGGLDSSSIACVAARFGRADLAVYSTLYSSWPDVDEQPWMRAVVESCGLPWHKLDVETMLPFSQLPGAFLGEPTHAVVDAAEHGRQNELLAAHGVTTLLTGHGGDTTFFAMGSAVPVHLADPLFDLRPMAALRAMTQWRDEAHEQRSTSYWILRGLMEPAADHLRGRRIMGREPYGLSSWIRQDYARKMRLDRRGSRRMAPSCRQPGRQAMWDSLWMCGLAMATVPQHHIGLQTRSPLMYRPLVEFMCSIPWEQKLRPRCDRYLQRRALKGVLPDLVRERAGKSGGTAVLAEGLRRSRDWRAYLCDTPLLAERGIVDADKWRQAVRQASVGHTHGDKSFLACVAIEAWLKQLEDHRVQLLAH